MASARPPSPQTDVSGAEASESRKTLHLASLYPQPRKPPARARIESLRPLTDTHTHTHTHRVFWLPAFSPRFLASHLARQIGVAAQPPPLARSRPRRGGGVVAAAGASRSSKLLQCSLVHLVVLSGRAQKQVTQSRRRQSLSEWASDLAGQAVVLIASTSATRHQQGSFLALGRIRPG